MPVRRRRRAERSSAAQVTTQLLLSFLAFSPVNAAVQDAPQVPIIPPPRIPQSTLDHLKGEHDFTLRHVFHRGTHQYPNLHRRLDVPKDAPIWMGDIQDGEAKHPSRLRVRSNGLQIQRLVDRDPSTIDGYLEAARYTGDAMTLSPGAWTVDEILGPNVTDHETVLNFATMAGNDYEEHPGEGEWKDITGQFNYSQSFGWEGDGLRGHIYADEGNETVVVSIKGTSPAVFDGSGTTTNDKENDNLFFSCCCGQGGNYFWRQVCDCYQTTYTCNQTCLVKALREPNRYYTAATELYTNVTALYPNANVWLNGHSLGGAVASLLGLTYGIPAVTFEAVPEALPAARLGLPVPPGYNSKTQQHRDFTGAFHFGHTADPVYMGTCNGATAVCTLGGYAMESQCHTGLRCVYDTVEDKGWRVGIGTHSIQNVIKDVIKAYNSTPSCEPDRECFDCYLWKFPESNGTETTTSSSSSSTSTRTRTSTCKTPGWWGCLDETTTTTTTSTSTSTTTTSPTTCHTPGWFGCKDPTTTTTTTSEISPTRSSPKASPTPMPTITTTRSPSTISSSSSLTTHTSCETPGYFWGCRDQTSTSPSSVLRTPSPTPTSKPSHKHCIRRSWWFGKCVDWEWDPDPDQQVIQQGGL